MYVPLDRGLIQGEGKTSRAFSGNIGIEFIKLL